MGMEAVKFISTPEEWATGFAIRIKDDRGNIWNLEGTRLEPHKLFDSSDRDAMNYMCDEIITLLNRKHMARG
jgi:hypothetical protein